MDQVIKHFFIQKIFAADTDGGIPLGPIGGSNGAGLGLFGNLGAQLFGKGQNGAITALKYITNIVSAVIGIMTIGGIIWFMIQLLTGGLNWITSAGEKAKLEEARNRLTHAMIGLIIVIAGWSILALFSQFFGFNLLIDPTAVINSVSSVLVGSK
jgi:hypothetical protein